MQGENPSDKLCLEATPCIVIITPGFTLYLGAIAAAPDYGELVSKSLPLAHKPVLCLVGLCAFFIKYFFGGVLYVVF